MSDDISLKSRFNRLVRRGRRDPAKSKVLDGSLTHSRASSPTHSIQDTPIGTPEHVAPSNTTAHFGASKSTAYSSALPLAARSTPLEAKGNSSPNNSATEAVAEIFHMVTGRQAAGVTANYSLWDKAYDTLKREEHHRLTAYEDLLSRVPIGTTTLHEKLDRSKVANQIPQHDAIARREKLKQIAELGLKHMEGKKTSATLLGHEIVLQDVIAKVAGSVEWAEDYVKEAVKDIPYASIVIAGVSLVLPLLKNPSAAEAANQDGLTYVISQMHYYAAMESLLLPEYMKADVRADLTERLVGLYKLIIDFQIQTVLRFYRSRTKNFLRGAINYDGWEKQVQDIKDSDRQLVKKCQTAMSSSSLNTLKSLVQEAETSRLALQSLLQKQQEFIEVNIDQLNIAQDSLGFAQKMDRRMSNAENRTCLQDLQATDPRDDKERIERDKGGLLRDSYCWILENSEFQQWRNNGQSQLLWIRGDPGKGKTMLLCGIIDELIKSTMNTANVSFFFCQASNSDINNASAVFRGLIYMLIKQQPSLISHLRQSYDDFGKRRFVGANAFIALSKIISSILSDPGLQDTYVIIDALDECTTDRNLLLDFIQKSSTYSNTKWIVSSRNWPSIEKALNKATQKASLHLELNDKYLSAAVSTYIRIKVDWLAIQNEYDSNTKKAVQRYLTLNANGTFLWVALVCQELAEISWWNAEEILTAFPPGLDALYRRMMDQICNSRNATLCKCILAVISVVYRPITVDELESLVDIPSRVSGNHKVLAEIIGLCGSFLTLRERTISFVHQSAKDFLLKEASHEIFPFGKHDVHHVIFLRSLQVLSRVLRRDIYDIRALGCPIEQVKQPNPDPLAESRYSCIYWVNHLCESNCNAKADYRIYLQDRDAVDEFVREKYLYWLEALSICRRISDGVISMTKLEALIQERAASSALIELVRDARRFIMYHKWVIESSPLQTYTSALIFSPAHSLIRDLFKEEEPKWITKKPVVGNKWSPCLQTLEGHSGIVFSVAFSHDSTQLASASEDNTVRIWDTSSGNCIQILEGHSGPAYSVAFSHDSTQLALASEDGTVRIWDTSSGKCLWIFKGHTGWVTSVAFSHDSIWLASASDDSTVRIWDTSSGKCLSIFKGHTRKVTSVAFSHNSAQLASASNDKTVKIWDTSSGKCLHTLKGHVSLVFSVAFSHDSTRVVSASQGSSKIKVWESSSGKCLQTLESDNTMVVSVAFAHDSTRIVSAGDDCIITIWDASSGECLQKLNGHSKSINSVTFSHDSIWLASASYDKTVKVWDTSSGNCIQTLEAHSDIVSSVTFSHNSAWLISASRDDTVKIWNTSSGECLKTLEDHSNWVLSAVFSHDSIWLASASDDKTIKVWDTRSGNCIHTLKGHRSRVTSVVFSHNSVSLASASQDCTIKIWDTRSGKCLQTLGDCIRMVTPIAFSLDSASLASNDSTAKIWDTSSSESLQSLSSYWNSVSSVAFSYDSILLASGSRGSTVKVWDTRSGECLQTLKGHIGDITSVAFSHDSARLISASEDGTIKIWDMYSTECLQTLSIGTALFNISVDPTCSYLHTSIGTIDIGPSLALNMTPRINPQNPRYQGWALSSDGKWVTYNSENLLWLPSEYRPSCSAVSDRTICIGGGSGKLWICNFGVDQSLNFL